MKKYTCPMHPEVVEDRPGKCPKCGMDLVPLAPKTHLGHAGHPNPSAMEEDFKRRFFFTLPLVLLTMLLSPNIQKWFGFTFVPPGHTLILFLIGTAIFFYGGWPFFKGAKNELTLKNAGMMTLVALAITVGYFFSVAATFLFPGESLYWEIATLISVFLLGHWLEMRAVRGATGALAELTKLIPPSAHLLKGGRITEIQTAEAKIGDRLLVKPGEKIPTDGVVVEGESAVNESMVTGESRPIGKSKGATVIGGTLNQDGSLTIEVTKVGSETVIAQISKLIAEAQASQPAVQHLADRAANVLTIVAILAGITTFLFWFLISPHGAIFAATLAVSVVVVACPHALGLAIPTVTTVTSALGAKNGILIKEMKGLEIAKKVDYIVFDKTGTLTKGEFGVTAVVPAENSKLKAQDLLRMAAAVDAHSQHAVAQGIVNQAQKQHLEIPKTEGFKSYPGRGASGNVNGQEVGVGNETFLRELGLEKGIHRLPEPETPAETPVYVVVDKKLEGAIFLADLVRDESLGVIQKLHKMGIKTALLTGDKKEVGEAVGRKLGVDMIFSQVLPEEKVDKVKQLQEEGHVVAMVGDGVNDAPSLTQAHVGIAIGAGTDVAIESADIVLMKNNPLDVVKAISLSRKTNVKMIQNLIWATGYNLLAIPTAGGILYSSFGILLRPEWAALLMSASSVIVVLNALQLRTAKLEL